jgi:predicted outer membrane protein
MMVAEDRQAEVQLSRLAAERSANPELKQLAQRLVEDHTKAN